MIVEFTNFLIENGLDAKAIGAKLVVTTAEVLLESQRHLLETTFGCKVQNEYGCGEVGPIAYECPEGGFHINAENVFIEILKTGNDRICGDEKAGEIVVTELRNFSMPLIRYRLGDYAMLSEKPCECGRGLPLLEGVFGRGYDFIVSPDGKRFHGEFIMYLFEDLKAKGMGIKQFQVLQLSEYSILIKIVKGTNFRDASTYQLEQNLKEVLGDSVKISFRFVDEIDREKSGKIRLVKSYLQNSLNSSE